MINTESVWVVIPAYNEAQVIVAVVRPLCEAGYKVVVVDDCSTDSTQLELSQTNAFVIAHPINLGQGAALQTGITFALRQKAAYIVTFDGDGQHLLSEIPKLLKPLFEHRCEVALGSRFMPGGRATNIPTARKILLALATVYTRIFTGLNVTDTHNGFRALTAQAAQKLTITQNRMAHATQILAEIKNHKLRYMEVPVEIIYTDYSSSKGQKVTGAFNIIWESITEYLGL